MQQDTQSHLLAIVCVAAPEDADLLSQWETHLHPLLQQQLISVWSEQHLVGGILLDQERASQLDKADLILLLLSAHFFVSPDCCAMMEQALKRSHTGTARVIPLLLRPVAWEESPLSRLAPWPSNRKPITLWSDEDEGWHACLQELRRLLGRQVSAALPSGRSARHADPDWDRMLRLLRRAYKELLDQSLHGIAWVHLGLSRRPDLVSNVTTLLFRGPQGGERLLAPGTSVLDAYDEAEGELLILGAPGAGKSTLVLDLAQRLVDRASTGALPWLPVILRLSSWALGRPALTEWMVEQFAQTYAVPRALAERWVSEGRVLPLLDGLDEMEEAARPLCIAAINAYHRTHLAPLVVCTRRAEYEGAITDERLALQSAVIVQPLSDEQIERYLSAAGPSFAGVRTALHQEQALRDLATTPLMLSVLLLTYRDLSPEDITQQGTDLERQVWTDYVARQVREKGNDARYSLEQTCAWLSWLAQQMRTHQQTTFYAEYLQTNWLPGSQQGIATQLTTRIPSMIIGICVVVLLSSFFMELSISPTIIGGFVGWCLSVAETPPQTRASHQFSIAVLFGGLLMVNDVLLLHVGSWSIFSLLSSLRDTCIFGLGCLLSGWAFQILITRQPKYWFPISQTHHGRLATWVSMAKSLYLWQAALFGMAIGVSNGIQIGFSNGLEMASRLGLNTGFRSGLREALEMGVDRGLSFGFATSVTVALVMVIFTSTFGRLHFAERIHWTWRSLFQPAHLRAVVIVAITTFVLFGLNGGISSGIYGSHWGWRAALNIVLNQWYSGPSIGGLSIGLMYWLILGLYQGMKQEHLEDQDRRQFNQGIRRSLRNGLLVGLMSALLMSTIGALSDVLRSVLSVVLGHELIFGLSYELGSALRDGLILLFPGMVVMWVLSGGLTILRHYIIRWLLARSRTFPWRAQAFLDDATSRTLLRRVGGGYSFIHRRLQDYFADAEGPPSQSYKPKIKQNLQ